MNVNLRKHQTRQSVAPQFPFGGVVSTFLPLQSSVVTPHTRVARSEFRFVPTLRREAQPLLQLAIFQHLRLPRVDHFGGLPCAPKQIANRLPVFHRESESDSVLPRKEVHAPFLVV